MFELLDGRKELFQWDLNRKIIVDDPAITEVHFCNKTGDCSLVCEVYEEDNIRVADIPNILLQTTWPIRVYGYCGDCYTKQSTQLKINARTKPADYVYTETEVETWDKLEARMEALEYQVTEKSIAEKVNDYLEENPVEIDLSDYNTKAEITEILDDYATKAHVTEELGNYNTKDEIVEILDDYTTEVYVTEQITYVTEEIANTAIQTKDEIVEILEDYATEAHVAEEIAKTEAKIPTVPTKISAFENDKKYTTEGYVAEEIKKTEAKIPTVPTKVSAFENDKGYLTEHQSLADYALKSEVATVNAISQYAKETADLAVNVANTTNQTVASVNTLVNSALNMARGAEDFAREVYDFSEDLAQTHAKDKTELNQAITNLRNTKQDNVSFDSGYDPSTNKAATVKTVTTKIAEVIAGAPEDYDTLVELSEWLYEHEDTAASMNAAIQQNASNIAKNTTAITNLNNATQQNVSNIERNATAISKLDNTTQQNARNIANNATAISNFTNGTDSVALAKQAKADEQNNVIHSTYETKADATKKINDLEDSLRGGELVVNKAQIAVNDGNGNNIATTYETKADANNKSTFNVGEYIAIGNDGAPGPRGGAYLSTDELMISTLNDNGASYTAFLQNSITVSKSNGNLVLTFPTDEIGNCAIATREWVEEVSPKVVRIF